MEYVWMVILIVTYFATWSYAIDEIDTSFSYSGVDFCKVWIYIHIVLFIIGVVGIFIYSLWLFIGK